MRLLIVEDAVELLRPLAEGLRRSGYDVDEATDGRTGLDLAQDRPYDLLILDVMLPGLDGLTLLSKLRDAASSTRVLMLTARDTLEDRVRGLRSGADDYLVKPFAFDELLARVEALLRRGRDVIDERLHVGPLTIDTRSKTAWRGEEAISLTPREYALLEYLVLNRGRVVSRTELEQRLYDSMVEPMSNVVDSAICVLRRKVDEPGATSLIQTRRGLGYVVLPADGQ